mmetsp:Transcript_37648/g.107709  ORF Transcript_37648/g.107709 Transcript_37648/m.107709 type:complete len:207 (+) Transcript_37648:225-845(+)
MDGSMVVYKSNGRVSVSHIVEYRIVVCCLVRPPVCSAHLHGVVPGRRRLHLHLRQRCTRQRHHSGHPADVRSITHANEQGEALPGPRHAHSLPADRVSLLLHRGGPRGLRRLVQLIDDAPPAAILALPPSGLGLGLGFGGLPATTTLCLGPCALGDAPDLTHRRETLRRLRSTLPAELHLPVAPVQTPTTNNTNSATTSATLESNT